MLAICHTYVSKWGVCVHANKASFFPQWRFFLSTSNTKHIYSPHKDTILALGHCYVKLMFATNTNICVLITLLSLHNFCVAHKHVMQLLPEREREKEFIL